MPSAAQAEDRYLKLKLKNQGRSDVISWVLKIQMSIEPGAKLANAINSTGESHAWEIKSENPSHMIPPDGDIEITLAHVGPFPIVAIKWSIVYTDRCVKGAKNLAGEQGRTVKNAFAT